MLCYKYKKKKKKKKKKKNELINIYERVITIKYNCPEVSHYAVSEQSSATGDLSICAKTIKLLIFFCA